MNNLPDEDTKLTNFLRQHRSIAQPELPELEDRLMSAIDLLPTHKQTGFPQAWRQYLVGGIGLIFTGIAGVAIFQIVNPPQPSIAELDRLNLFLEAYAPNLTDHSEIDPANYEDLGDLDRELL